MLHDLYLNYQLTESKTGLNYQEIFAFEMVNNFLNSWEIGDNVKCASAT